MIVMSLVLLLASLVAGCATTPQLPQDEWLRIKTRTYPGATPKQAVAAAEQLFRLADGGDFVLSYTPDGSGLRATRRFIAMAVALGVPASSETWTLTTIAQPDGTRIGVDVTGMAAGGAATVESPALYELFWTRMDYILGRSTEWRTCEQQQLRVESSATRGVLDALCMMADDEVPPGVQAIRPQVGPPPSR